jgi:uncharacterized protein YoxC
VDKQIAQQAFNRLATRINSAAQLIEKRTKTEMTDEPNGQKNTTSEEILQQQYLRALSSFEGIVLSQIDVKNRLGDRLNYSIRTGVIILGVIAISILILLLSLSSQVNRIASVVGDINSHFRVISSNMQQVNAHMQTMEQRVALIESMSRQVAIMDKEMAGIDKDMNDMNATVSGIRQNLSTVRQRVGAMAVNVDHINLELQGITQEVHRFGTPARTMNKMFPFQ